MSGLPDQDLIDSDPDEKRYSKNDLQHIIAREQAARDVKRIDAEVISLHKQVLEANTTSALESKALREMLMALPTTLALQIDKCRTDLKEEIKDLHPTRLENLAMKNDIEGKIADTDRTLGKQIAAVDTELSAEIDAMNTSFTREITEVKTELSKQWLRIVGPITGIIAFAMVITWLLMVYTKVNGG